jgi:high affinity Mn2+ porin
MMPLMIKPLHKLLGLAYCCVGCLDGFAQSDSTKFQLHFQQTVVTQYHPGFSASYSGTNSLSTREEAQTSLTTTLYSGIKLAPQTRLFFNPEIAGGAGLSRATGVAGFPNGETFRVGNPKPQIYVARLYVDQYIPLSKARKQVAEDINQLAGSIPTHYVRAVAGRFAISDFFDNNTYSHDPRTRFLNWSLMSNGAYDYAANTRGYTWGFMLEYRKERVAVRSAAALVPKEANASNMNADVSKALAKQIEIEWNWGNTNPGVIRGLIFHNTANMGSYNLAIQQAALYGKNPDIISTRSSGRSKYGFGLNAEQKINEGLGTFARLSWNDGKNETWMFTEIENSASVGVVGKGNTSRWGEDMWGAAIVSNGISKEHQRYLAAGGTGFMVGDGNLNYGREWIVELFYNALLHDNHLYITPDYQFVINPAYNKARGPVHIFAIRVQTKF